MLERVAWGPRSALGGRARETGPPGYAVVVLFHLARLSAWRAGLGPPSEPGEDAALRWAPDEAKALEVANAVFRDEIEPVVALVVDEEAAGGPGPIEPKAVTEIRYLRRDPADDYVTVERRPPLAEALNLSPHPEGGWFRETWVSPVEVAPNGYKGTRATVTLRNGRVRGGDRE